MRMGLQTQPRGLRCLPPAVFPLGPDIRQRPMASGACQGQPQESLLAPSILVQPHRGGHIRTQVRGLPLFSEKSTSSRKIKGLCGGGMAKVLCPPGSSLGVLEGPLAGHGAQVTPD